MNRKTIAAILTVCMLIFVSACEDGKPVYYSEKETFHTTNTETTKSSYYQIFENSYEYAVLYSESGAEYKFRYDNDILAYTKQGGTFYLVGTDATKCFIHIIVQDTPGKSYEEAKISCTGKNIKEITLNSGRKAFYYNVPNDGTNCHIMIDASEIVPSGKGVINCYVGSQGSWEYTEEKIATMIDNGFVPAN